MDPTYGFNGRDVRRISNTVSAHENGRRKAPISRRRGVTVSGSGGDGSVFRAKTQEAAQADGLISVKLLDSAGTEYDTAFDVYVFQSKAATDFTTAYYNSETGAVMANGDYISIYKSGNDYVMITPALIKVESITVMTNFNVDTTNSELEKKIRESVKVIATGNESAAWVLVHTGTECT